jgi:hypothetical protein
MGSFVVLTYVMQEHCMDHVPNHHGQYWITPARCVYSSRDRQRLRSAGGIKLKAA